MLIDRARSLGVLVMGICALAVAQLGPATIAVLVAPAPACAQDSDCDLEIRCSADSDCGECECKGRPFGRCEPRADNH